MDEPRLSVELEDDDKMSPEEWTAKALLLLAAQLGVMNDFYYPLVGAAAIIEKRRDDLSP